jgi:hypothetical protein
VKGILDGAPAGQIDARWPKIRAAGCGSRRAQRRPVRPGEPVVVLVFEVANHHAGFEQTSGDHRLVAGCVDRVREQP